MQIEQTSISPFWPIAKWTMVALTAVSVLANIFFYFANSYEWLTVRSVYYILDSLLFLAATVLMFFFAPARMMRIAGAAFAIGNILFVILGYVGYHMDSYITTVLRGMAALVMLSGFAVRNENRPSVNSRGVILNIRKQPATIPIKAIRSITVICLIPFL